MAFFCYRGSVQEGGVCLTKQIYIPEAWKYIWWSVTGSGCFYLVLYNILLYLPSIWRMYDTKEKEVGTLLSLHSSGDKM